jgi:hypothetical protein
LPGAAPLPVSGIALRLHEPVGEDELLVLESSGPPVQTMVALAARLATTRADARPVDWLGVPAVDLAAAALQVRAAWLGGTIRTEALCTAEGCSEPIDVSFGVAAYLEHHRPRRFRGVTEAEAGWFALAGTDVQLRIPTVADVVDGTLESCVRPADLSPAEARRVDRALEALAPRLDGALTGRCPACGKTVDLHFEPIGYVLAELRDASVGLFAEVHALARAYHWSEQAILALSRRRRRGYVALVHEEYAPV